MDKRAAGAAGAHTTKKKRYRTGSGGARTRRAVEGQGAKAHAHLLLHYQKKSGGYFTSELFQTHVRDVIGVMKWKECLKGKEIWLVFDNSRVHDAMCPGGLYAQHMRLNDGSKDAADVD